MRTIIVVAIFASLTPLQLRAASPAIALQGRGVQIYACDKAQDGFAWRLVAPDAELFDSAGKKVGHHFAGPSWQATDGSLVKGAVMASGAAPEPKDVPWLLLRVQSHSGSGAFTSAGYIIRANTQGGAAPQTGCDAAHEGTEHRVPYRATYILLPGG